MSTHWEVYAGVSVVDAGGKRCLPILVLQFLTERDARAYGREQLAKVFRVSGGERSQLTIRYPKGKEPR